MHELLNTLSLCRRAGKLIMGFDPVKAAVAAGQAKAVLLASDLAPRSKKEVRFFCRDTGLSPIESPFTLDDIKNKFGRRAGIFAITDQGLAQKTVLIVERLQQLPQPGDSPAAYIERETPDE